MGTFIGHAIPGSFFIILALWWTIHMFNRYYSNAARKRNSKFSSAATFKCSCLCGRLKDWPMEAYIKMIFISLGIFYETGAGYGQISSQHVTMFSFFVLASFMEILMHFKAPLPPDMDYISMIMALMCEYLLFKHHLHGRKDLDVLLHTLLLNVIAGSIIAFLLELRYRNNILCALSRPYFMMLQGTWFWQVGWILYPPFASSQHWNQEDHEQMMIATSIFAGHAGTVLLIILAIGGVVSCVHRFGSYTEDDGVAMERLIQTSSNGGNVVHMDDDSESEIEFEKAMKLK